MKKEEGELEEEDDAADMILQLDDERDMGVNNLCLNLNDSLSKILPD